MPDGFDAVIIDTTFIAPLAPVVIQGVPMLISNEGIDDTISEADAQYYDSIEELITAHSDCPRLVQCAKSLAKNYEGRVGVCIYYGGRNDISETYETLENEARIHNFSSVTIAGYTYDGTTAWLLEPAGKKSFIEFCDANQIIFVLPLTAPSPENSITIDTMLALRDRIVSPNVYAVAHNDYEATDDIGGAVLGVLETTKPEVTMMWKNVKCDVYKYFKNKDVNKLEKEHINVILQDYGLSESYTTDKFVQDKNTEDSIVQDISISRQIYWIKRLLQVEMINLRKNTVKLGYTNNSLNMISAAITTVLEDNKVNALNPNGMIDSYKVTMPLLENITPYEKSLNILQNVIIEIVLTGEIHRFHFSLVVSLGGT